MRAMQRSRNHNDSHILKSSSCQWSNMNQISTGFPMTLMRAFQLKEIRKRNKILASTITCNQNLIYVAPTKYLSKRNAFYLIPRHDKTEYVCNT